MTQDQLRLLVSEILLKLEGDDRICDIIAETAMETLEEYGVDGGTDEGFDALSDVVSSITLYSCL